MDDLGICDLSVASVVRRPFAHVVKPDFILGTAYQELRATFPECQPSTGPTGHSLYWGDEGYEQLLASSPAWKALHNTFHSELFIQRAIERFGDVWAREGCRVDLSRARYVAYREDRIDKQRKSLRKVEHEPHELWVRMDIHQGHVGYSRPVHLDHARRLISMLVYFCDHADHEIVGGELLLHSGPSQRWYHRRPVRIVPKHNLMVLFPCTRRSFHSVPRVESLNAPRNFLQVTISSSADAW
jgi:hypothetical protein